MTNTNESGRSMVEMLGVLAIIGVLSVMGIAGYTQAMKKYRSNEAAAAISMAAMLCGSSKSVGGLTSDFVEGLDCGGVNDRAATWTKYAEGVDAKAVAAMLKIDENATTYQIIS